MQQAQKAYKGLAMEGVIATWYAKNTARDVRRFKEVARTLFERVAPPARVLEVALGPGYLAVQMAKAGYKTAAVDISQSFVRMVGENAKKAGVAVDVRLGDAAALPFDDASFDYVVCMAAFKNFTNPLGALDEFHRVLEPGGQASIYDLRKDAAPADIETEVRNLGLSAINKLLTRWTFRHMLLKSAYTVEQIERLGRQSRFGGGSVTMSGIGFELRLRK